VTGDERFTEHDGARFGHPVIVHVIPVYDGMTPAEAFALMAEHGCFETRAVCPPFAARAGAGDEPGWHVAVTHAETGALVGFLGADGEVVA
jgi:hypothetical protein